jgi:hypothetical protein
VSEHGPGPRQDRREVAAGGVRRPLRPGVHRAGLGQLRHRYLGRLAVARAHGQVPGSQLDVPVRAEGTQGGRHPYRPQWTVDIVPVGTVPVEELPGGAGQVTGTARLAQPLP